MDEMPRNEGRAPARRGLRETHVAGRGPVVGVAVLLLVLGGLTLPSAAQPVRPATPGPLPSRPPPPGFPTLPTPSTPTCLSPKGVTPSAVAGQYCGGVPPIQVGRTLDVDHECKALYGGNASSGVQRQDAYGWVCRVPGQPDRGITDMHRACRRSYGGNAIATLVGIGLYDWRCLTPAEVRGRVVPVLLYPVDHLESDPAAFATEALARVDTLMSGVRSFYQGKTSALIRGTNAFLLLTRTSGVDWQNLALCTDQAACAYIGNPFPWNDESRFRYLNRAKSELTDGQWNKLISHSSMRLAAFVTLGASPPQTPTWCGAADLVSGNIMVAAPSGSYASCSAATNIPPDYEDAFYGAAHELGHAFGLPHSDDPGDPDNPNDGCMNNPPVYVFNDTNPNSNLLRPPNLPDSIMCLGRGTSSELFPFEVHKVLPFLLGWH